VAEHDQEKTEHESQKKLEESRKKGELPHSRELATFVTLSLFLIYFSISRMNIFEEFGEITSDLLVFDRHLGLTPDNLGEFFLLPVMKTIGVMAPLFALVLFISPLISMGQTGFNIATEKLTPNVERLNPKQGLKRIISRRQVVEGLKSALKIGLFAYLSWTVVMDYLPSIQLIGSRALYGQVELMMQVAISIGLRIVILLAILALLDYAYQWWEFKKKIKLTHQELKDEMKEREGNPLIKQRQRSLQMQRARDSMMRSRRRM
jgi:flagellar biosynthetic protein FlhB